MSSEQEKKITPRSKACARYATEYCDGLDEFTGQALRDEIARRCEDFGVTVETLDDDDIKRAYVNMVATRYHKESEASYIGYKAQRSSLTDSFVSKP